MPANKHSNLQAAPAADRLRQALVELTSDAPGQDRPVTVSALCLLAQVSRNSLYRYHPTVLEELRAHQKQHRHTVPARSPTLADDEQAELASMRQQVSKLASLVDHYYAAYREAHGLLMRRESELAELRRRLDCKPVKIAG